MSEFARTIALNRSHILQQHLLGSSIIEGSAQETEIYVQQGAMAQRLGLLK
jgi:hypothetical protein